MPIALFGLGLLCIAAGIIGLVLPMLPGTPLVALGAVLMAAADGFTRVGWLPLVVIVLLGALGWAVEHLTAVVGARTAGGSWWGVAGASLGLIVGLPFGLPGLVIGPGIGAFAFEYARNQRLRAAAKAGAGVLVGFLVGTVLKFAFAGAMIGVLVAAYMF